MPPGPLASVMMAAERRGKSLSLKRKRNISDEPSTSSENPVQTPTDEMCNRGINNSRVGPQMCVGDRLRRRSTADFRQSQDWTVLPDLPPWFGFEGKEKDETPKHETIKMGTVSIEWTPLPKHCQICLVRTRQKRVAQVQELSTGKLSLNTLSAALVSGEQVPASLQRSRSSKNWSENNVMKETVKESCLGRTVMKEDLSVIGSEKPSTSQAKNDGVYLPPRDINSKSLERKIDARKLQMTKTTIKKPGAGHSLVQDQKKEHLQTAKSETKVFKALPASLKMKGTDKSVELIEEIDVEREKSRWDNVQASHSSTVKNADHGRRTLRKEDLSVLSSESPSTSQAKNAGVYLPPRDNHSKSSEKKIDASDHQMKRTSIKNPDTIQISVRDLKQVKTDERHEKVGMIEEFDVERDISRREYTQGIYSSTKKRADSEATKSFVKSPTNESYVKLCAKDSNSTKVESNDTQKELIEEFDYQTSDGKMSVKTVSQSSKDQLPRGSAVKSVPTPPAKKKFEKKNVDPSNSSITSHFKKCNISWNASPARGETLGFKRPSPEIINLDSDEDDDILPPSPLKQFSASWKTPKRKFSETSSEKDGTAVKKPKLVSLVSAVPGTSGGLAKSLIPDQKSHSSSMAGQGQTQSCGKTTNSKTIKTYPNQSGFQTANDIQTNRDVHSRPNHGNYQGSYPQQGITTHTPLGINRDIQHPNRGINQDQQANRDTKQDQNVKRDSIPSPVIQICPLCTMEFKQGWSQVQKDGHVAWCLSLSEDDVSW